MPLKDSWDAEAVLAIRATPRRPTPSISDEFFRALVVGGNGEPKEPKDTRKEVVERRLAAERDAESGAGLPLPEASDRSEIVGYSNTVSLKTVRDVKGVLWVDEKIVHSEECQLRLKRALASDDVDICVVEREVLRRQAKVDRHAGSAGEAVPQPHGVQGDMVFPADELQPAKHQESGVVAAEADAGTVDADEKVYDDEAAPHAAHAVPEDDIPELEDDDEPIEQAPLQDFIESDEEIGPASPGAGPGTPRLDEGPEQEKPNAKRSRLSRITNLQILCKIEQLKSRNDFAEIVRQIDRSQTFAI